MNKEIKTLIVLVAVFLLFYFVPLDSPKIGGAVLAGLALINDYARQHVLTCLVPAFFIAGAVAVYVKKDFVLKYLGSQVKKHISYLVASVSGIVLAVCSCTVLPLFAGIYKRGAGLGPAITFLFSGPAINIAAIFLTLSVLGFEIGIARIIASILMAIIVGISMHYIFREKSLGTDLQINKSEANKHSSKLVLVFTLTMVAILVVNGLAIEQNLKYILMIVLALITALIANFKFKKESNKEWLEETWKFTKMLLPLLFIGVFIAGFIMPFLPEQLIIQVVGKNNVIGNLVASVFGAFMYFSTLTEIPILQVFLSKGMNQGPALALLLAGPSLSLPNLLVIRKVLGNKKTVVYALLVILFSGVSGLIFGSFF